jgi:ABC-type cobalamin/Fe3+-siderophores transport system ATPase subunit
MKLSKEIKIDIFDAIQNEPNVFGLGKESESLISFVNEIWDLRRMPSEDSRYPDAEGDFYQHLVNNDDWDIDYVFLQRLRIAEEDNDAKFISLIETLLKPKHKRNADEIIKFVLIIDPYLEKEGLKLAIQDYDNNNAPIYKIYEKAAVALLPPKTKQNAIPFFFRSTNGRADYSHTHTKPTQYPAFVVTFNEGWNDYSFRTTFYLFYYSSSKTVSSIGEVKIMRGEVEFLTVIPKEFTELTDDFCSLGQSIEYYKIMNNIFGKDLESVLYALKDAAFYPKILEKFEHFEKFKTSMIRGDRIERLLREARFEIYGFDLNKLYQFKYNFKPAYAEEAISVNFDFDTSGKISNRIIALIGKNGTGKTQLLTSLPANISKKEDDFFTPKTPRFSKVIAISYSIFDQFDIPRPNADFNYVYCGLRTEKGLLKSKIELEQQFLEAWTQIALKDRMELWHQVLSNFLDENTIARLHLIHFNNEAGEAKWRINTEGFNEIKKVLSSGQSILLYIISEITANMRLDALILYDEPETHLHPNAISQLINAVYNLVEEFQSYCIIATHSPLVIREIPSKSVFVVERFGNIPMIRGISQESFGGNINTLTEEVFGNREITKKHELIVEKLVLQKYSYEQILEMLEFDGIPVNLNIRLYAKSLIGG